MNTHPNGLQTGEAYLLFAHGRDDRDKEIFTFFESSQDLSANVTLWGLNIVLRGSVRGHQVKETIINVDLENTNGYPSTADVFIYKNSFKKHLQVGILYAGRWGRPCCG